MIVLIVYDTSVFAVYCFVVCIVGPTICMHVNVHFSFIVLVLHAPHMGHEEAFKDTFWNSVWHVMHELRCSHPNASFRILCDCGKEIHEVVEANLPLFDAFNRRSSAMRLATSARYRSLTSARPHKK